MSICLSYCHEASRKGITQAPIIQKQWLQGHTDGLIALSGGQRGELAKAFLAGGEKHSLILLEQYRQLFPNRFHIEQNRVGRPYEEEYIAGVLQLAAQSQKPVVATNDAHFMRESDFDAHEVRVRIQ